MALLKSADEGLSAASKSPKTGLALGLIGIGVGLPAIFVSPVAAAILVTAIIVVLALVVIYAAINRKRYEQPYEVLACDYYVGH